MSATRLVMLCRARGITVATAESCTGGLIAAAITEIPGSSAMFTHGFVTYANAAKTGMLGVPEGLINSVGAVSEAVARRMAEGARARAGATLAVSVTGVAGPDGGSAEKPVGTVWFGLATPTGVTTYAKRFQGGRREVREQSVAFALELLIKASSSFFEKKEPKKTFVSFYMGCCQVPWEQKSFAELFFRKATAFLEEQQCPKTSPTGKKPSAKAAR